MKYLIPMLAFAAGLAFFAARGAGTPAAMPVARPVLTGTSADIPTLQNAVRGGRGDLRPSLAEAYLQKARETADPAFYAKASGVLGRPHNEEGYATAGELALAKHDFAGALTLGRRAGAVGATIRVDALVELGRYEEATAELQAMVDRKPNLSGYARVSYLRELHGDLTGAVEAMRLAVDAGGPAAENGAYVSALLGELDRRRGRRTAARRAFMRALAMVPNHAASIAGLARLEGPRRAIARLRPLVERLPLPEYVIALGEDELALGQDASKTFALVGAEERLLRAAGVDVDVELSLFEADHGDPAKAVALARRGYENAPSIRAADALGWALTQNGQDGRRYLREALRLGSVDPLWLAHYGLATGSRNALKSALEHGLRGYPWQARRVIRRLGRGAM